MDFALEKRQVFVEDQTGTLMTSDGDFDNSGGDFWSSPEAEIIKWLVVGGITLLFMTWLVGGYIHAKRRVRMGLKPLPYHIFLLPRHQRAKFEAQNNFSFYRQDNQGYQMDNYGPPPPVYNPGQPTPPDYLLLHGVTKINPSQEWVAPPPAPPERNCSR